MKRVILSLLLALLAGCGSEKSPDQGGASPGGRAGPAAGDLADLDGLPVAEFIRAFVPRLAKEPGLQNAAGLAASLDQKWKIHCEKICRIERK